MFMAYSLFNLVSPDAMQRGAVHRRAGTVSNAVFVTVPVLHRVTACRNAPGTRGAFHVSNPCFMMFMAHSLHLLIRHCEERELRSDPVLAS